jgi:hypothetical protein
MTDLGSLGGTCAFPFALNKGQTMNATTSPSRTVLITFCALAVPMGLAAQDANKPRHHHYNLIDIGTFGGPNSYFTFTNRSLNNRGLAIGSADTSLAVNPPFCFIDCYLVHAFQWREGALTDLGGLPGVTIPGSAPNDINARGVVAGVALQRPRACSIEVIQNSLSGHAETGGNSEKSVRHPPRGVQVPLPTDRPRFGTINSLPARRGVGPGGQIVHTHPDPLRLTLRRLPPA